MLQVACCSSIPATLLCLTFWYLRYGFSLRSDIVWIVACWNYHVLRKLSISAERVIDHILYICQLCLSELHFTGIITLLFNLERGKKTHFTLAGLARNHPPHCFSLSVPGEGILCATFPEKAWSVVRLLCMPSTQGVHHSTGKRKKLEKRRIDAT